MIKINEQVAHALRRLQAPEFAPLVDALKANLAADMDALVFATDTSVIQRLQGEAMFLKSFIGNIEQSESLLTKIKMS